MKKNLPWRSRSHCSPRSLGMVRFSHHKSRKRRHDKRDSYPHRLQPRRSRPWLLWRFPAQTSELRPGDVLVYPARPSHKYGHAMIVADVAKNSSGKIAILCVEGNTPARDMHVVRNLNPLSNPWFFIDKDDDLHFISLFQYYSKEFRYYP